MKIDKILCVTEDFSSVGKAHGFEIKRTIRLSIINTTVIRISLSHQNPVALLNLST